MYYLNTRYYDPQIGRFINADGQLNSTMLGYNMYAYCENNPVMYVDLWGLTSWQKAIGWSWTSGKSARCAVKLPVRCCGLLLSGCKEITAFGR